MSGLIDADVGAEMIIDASLHSRSSSLDSSTQQQQQQPHHTSPTPTPSDDLTPVSVGADSTTKDASSMDASKSTMWLGTEDGW